MSVDEEEVKDDAPVSRSMFYSGETDADTRLLRAAWDGDEPEIVSALKAGADVDAPALQSGGTAVMLAVANRHLAVVELLVEKGANTLPEVQNNAGQNVLHYAVVPNRFVDTAKHDDPKLLKWLLNNAFNRDLSLIGRDKDGDTVLITAARFGLAKLVDFLLTMPTVMTTRYLDIKGQYGLTAAERAAMNNHLSVCKRLQDAWDQAEVAEKFAPVAVVDDSCKTCTLLKADLAAANDRIAELEAELEDCQKRLTTATADTAFYKDKFMNARESKSRGRSRER